MRAAYFFLVILIMTNSCSGEKPDFPYKFELPNETIILKNELKEISGLDFLDDDTLYGVNDERGIVYKIDLKNGKHTKLIEFKKEGDFEGIAKVGGEFYTLKSNGLIYRIDSKGIQKKYKFHKKGFEFEGLCYSDSLNSLLVACKKHKSKNKSIWIYQFDLETGKYLDAPFIKIKKELVHKGFRASAIAIHPNGNIFIASASSYTMAEFDKEGFFLRKIQFPFYLYPQVEGICFNKKGDLYVSSEKSTQEHAKIIRLEANE